jgi:hypothetical protein
MITSRLGLASPFSPDAVVAPRRTIRLMQGRRLYSITLAVDASARSGGKGSPGNSTSVRVAEC